MGKKKSSDPSTESPSTPITDTPANPSGDFPFDLEELRLPQNFDGLGAKKAFLTIPVRKPDSQVFFRTWPDENVMIPTPVLTMKEDREVYLVNRALWPDLQTEIVPHLLTIAVTRQGVLFVWPVRLPSSNGRQNAWHTSALQAAHLARTRWIRLQANMNLGAYEVFEAAGTLSEPEWPVTLAPDQILKTAFKNLYIESLDHPALRRLRGEL